MKVGIITFHFASNCGAVLQCVALQKALQKMGHTVEVIDYRPLYHRNRFEPYKNPFVQAQERFRYVSQMKGFSNGCAAAAKGFWKALSSWKQAPEKAYCREKFEEFISANVTQTRRFNSYATLKKAQLGFDAYVAGSDQLWSQAITGQQFDPAYFLNFCGSDDLCFTYAVGGALPAQQETAQQLARLIEPLKAIGLREKSSMPCVEMACEAAGKPNTEISCQCDPTFLLDAEEYRSMEDSTIDFAEPYIFVYTVADTSKKTVVACAKQLALETGLSVVYASNNPSPTDANGAVFCSPAEFLSYVKNAEYMVTNSFHGTAFSLIYGTRFVSVPHSVTGNRVTELLEALQLSDRCCTEPPGDFVTLFKENDSVSYEETMAKMKVVGLDYLQRQLLC